MQVGERGRGGRRGWGEREVGRTEREACLDLEGCR